MGRNERVTIPAGHGKAVRSVSRVNILRFTQRCKKNLWVRKLMLALAGSSDGIRGLPDIRLPDRLLPIESVDHWVHRAALVETV